MKRFSNDKNVMICCCYLTFEIGLYVKSCSSTKLRNNLDSCLWLDFFYSGSWETSKAFSNHKKSCITAFDLRLEVKNQDFFWMYF